MRELLRMSEDNKKKLPDPTTSYEEGTLMSITQVDSTDSHRELFSRLGSIKAVWRRAFVDLIDMLLFIM
jgi:hypothetical protein